MKISHVDVDWSSLNRFLAVSDKKMKKNIYKIMDIGIVMKLVSF